jgi:glucokinase
MTRSPIAIGLDIGGTNMRAARVSAEGEILEKSIIAGSRDPAAAIDKMAGLIAGMLGPDVVAIGIGVPGRVDPEAGEMLSGGFLNLAGTGFRAGFEARFGLPVRLANDCSMALYAEAAIGAARGIRRPVMLTIGTGIGGAAMTDERLAEGRHAGQLGHVVVDHAGEPCLCGRRGCVETTSSGTALGRHLAAAGYGPEARIEAILAAAGSGDERALGVVRAWAGPLRAAIGGLAAAFDPGVVLLGGGLGTRAVEALAFVPDSDSWYPADVRAASLGDDAGMIGSGLAALELAGRTARAREKRVVLLNGVPASGKSSLSKAITEATGWPVLAIDTVKNPFLEMIEGVDRTFNRTLGRASYKAMWSIIAEAPAGSTFVVDAWFGFQPIDVLRDHIARSGVAKVVEIWCHAPPEVVGERYRTRALSGTRPAGHPGESYVPELMALAARATPTGLAPLYDVDTTEPVDTAAMLAWIGHEFGDR